MAGALIIAIGNRSRGDDGVAHLVADAIEDRLPEGVRLLRTHQLDIVMAEDVAGASAVYFIDAHRRTEPLVEISPVAPTSAPLGAHVVDPGALVALARALYGAAPTAQLVSVAAPEMGHGEHLSDIAHAATEQAAERVLDGLR